MANFKFLGKLTKRVSKGLSTFIRKIVEHKSFRLTTGITIVLTVFLSSVFVQKTQAFSSEDFRSSVIVTEQTTLATKRTSRLPVAGRLSQGFSSYHQGIDIEKEFNDPINPFLGGVVFETGFQPGGYGNYIVIDHKNGYLSLYAHLNKIMVQKGDETTQDTIIGTVGLTGWTTGSHLHFGVYENGEPVNPLSLLPELPVATPSALTVLPVGGPHSAKEPVNEQKQTTTNEKILDNFLLSSQSAKVEVKKNSEKLPLLDILK